MKQWYRISNQKNKRAKILIYEQIGVDWFGDGVSAKEFNKELDALDVNDIDLHINSPGGNVFDGNSIYNALVNHKAKVHVKVDGIAASIASVIAMAGDDVEMPKNAMMMIHDPSGFVVGTSADMKKMSGALDKIKGGLISAYRRRSNKTEDQISDMMTDETWLTADEALAAGFADNVSESVSISANFRGLSNFKNVPECLRAENKQQQQTPADAGKKEDVTMEITLELIQSKHPEIVAGILKTVTAEYLKKEHPDIANAMIDEGAKKENERIKAVGAQLIPGHEKLIEDLMFDGKTTGEQAAVKVLAAEKEIRTKAIANHQADAPDPVVQPATDDIDAADDNLPIEDRCKKAWDKDPGLRKEFGNDFDGYLAHEKAVAGGQVRVLKPKAS